MNFNQLIRSYSEEMIRSLQELIRIRSVEDLNVGGYPFGTGVHQCLMQCLALGKSMGFNVCNADNMVGWCEYGEGEEMVAVLGHLDVVPEGSGWNYPPFEGIIENGKLYGRGAIDNKGPVIASLFALRALRESGVHLSRRVRVIFGLNEETGSADIKYYVRNGYELPIMGFTPDGEYPIINGEKGIVTVAYRCPLGGEGHSIRSIKGGIAPNVVPDYACAELDFPEAERGAVYRFDEDKVRITEIPDGLKVEAWGVNAHGSTPKKGENAIGRLLLTLGKLQLSGASGQFVDFMNRMIGMETRGRSLGIYMKDNISGDMIVNLGMIEADSKNAVIKLNLRYPVTHTFEEFIGTLRGKMAEGYFEEISMVHKHSIYMPPEAPLIRKLSTVYEEQTGEKATLLSIGGGTYAKAMPNIVAFGPIFPGDDIMEHKPNEYIEIEKLIRNAQIIASAMYELAK
jgi:succinyl-diaminopimelate desuccinylase